jgi:predicted nucleic acid-binding protein
MWVVDASVALKWVIDEEGSEAAGELAGEPLSAPGLLLAECANVLWVKAQRKEISPQEVFERLDLLRSAPVLLVPVQDLVEDATRLAIELEHPVYDCLYLALAMRQDARLVTADRRLARAVRAHGRFSPFLRLLGEP